MIQLKKNSSGRKRLKFPSYLHWHFYIECITVAQPGFQGRRGSTSNLTKVVLKKQLLVYSCHLEMGSSALKCTIKLHN